MDVQKVEAHLELGVEHSIQKNLKINQFNINGARIYQRNFKLVRSNYSGPSLLIASQITSIRFHMCTLVEFPQFEILLDLCKNLTALRITSCNIARIARENLRGLGSLKELNLSSNEIEKLPKGLFDFTPKMEIVLFWRNKIHEIDPDILQPLKNLRFMCLSRNIGIDVLYDGINGQGNVTLEQLKQEIRKCPPTEQVIAEMKIETAKVLAEIKKVNEDAAKLKEENVTLKRKYEEIEEKFNNLSGEMKKFKEMKGTPINDFTVTIKGKDFRVNKAILAVNSPVLAKIMSENQEADHLELEHITEATFEEILKFMYEKNSPDKAANMVELFSASARLEMNDLKDMTASILMERVTPDNALDVMNLSNKYHHDELSKKAFDELKKKFSN